MNRVLKRRRKRCAGGQDERILKQDHLLQTGLSKWEKIVGKLPGSNSYPDVDDPGRLSGGADDVAGGFGDQTSSVEPEKSDSHGVIIESGVSGVSSAPEPPQESIGDKQVEETIDYVLQHLQEARKVMESLCGDHEDNLKMMFMEIMKKLQNKISTAESNIATANNGLNDLRRKLISRNEEIQELRIKLTECERKNASYRKAMADKGMRSTIGTNPSSSMIQLAPMAPPVAPSSVRFEGTSSLKITPSELSSRLHQGSQLQSNESSSEIPGNLQFSGRPGVPQGSALQSTVFMGASGANATGTKNPSTIPIEQLPRYDPKSSIFRDSEVGRSRREVELEAQIDHLRQENQRIIQESADYDEAVQQALLKGVSSLNVEALKVLKNPPIGCYLPCLPCNPADDGITTINKQSVIPMEDNWTPQRDKPILHSKLNGFSRQRDEGKAKKPAQSVCNPSRIDRKSSKTAMVFLLPQTPEINNTCVTYPRMTARPIGGVSRSLCLDGRNRKGSIPSRDKFYPSKAERSRFCDPCNKIRGIFDN